MPGVQETERSEFMLGDFDGDALVGRWQGRGVSASLSNEHVTHGRHSLRVTYGTGRAPKVRLAIPDDQPRAYDWSRYASFNLDVWNDAPTQERLFLELKDSANRTYKEEILVRGRTSARVDVDTGGLSDYLDVHAIREVAFFRWQPTAEVTLYLDGIRLSGPPETGLPMSRLGRPVSDRLAPDRNWQVEWTSPLVKVFREPALFQGHAHGPARIALAAGEREGVQVVVVGAADHSVRVRLSLTPFRRTDGGAEIRSESVEVRRVDYVPTREPYYPVVHGGDWPDPLPAAHEAQVPTALLQPFWLTVHAPADQPPGDYASVITLDGSDGHTEKLEIVVHVWGFTLPRRSHLKTAFDLYLGRLRQAYPTAGNVDGLKARYYEDMLEHRLSPILAADPTDARFESDIAVDLERGITAFGIGEEGLLLSSPAGSPQWAERVGWLRQAARALRDRGLLDRAYVYAYDEPPPGMPRVAQDLSAIHQADPGLRTLLTLHEAPDPVRDAAWLTDADILVVRNAALDSELVDRYQSLGKEVWLYVSSPAHPCPSLNLDSPSLAVRILPWMCWKYGLRGLLYWSVNYWRGDPYLNPATFAEDQNGNGFLYYPGVAGPVPSIRLEVLRDGLEDYEYLSLLNERLSRTRSDFRGSTPVATAARELLDVPPEIVTSFRRYARDPHEIDERRAAIAAAIESLGR